MSFGRIDTNNDGQISLGESYLGRAAKKLFGTVKDSVSNFLNPKPPKLFDPTDVDPNYVYPTPKPKTPLQVMSPTNTPKPTPSVLSAFTPASGRSEKFKQAYSPDRAEIVNEIVKVSKEYGINPELMLDIAAQESLLGKIERTAGYHPTARSASGVYQFINTTWAENAKKYAKQLGIETPNYPEYSKEWLDWIDKYRLDPKTNIRLAALILKNKGLSNWLASKNVWGQNYTEDELQPYYR